MTDITQFIYYLKEWDEYPAQLISYGKTTFKFLGNSLEIAINFKQEIVDVFRKKHHITDKDAIYFGIYRNNLVWRLIPHSARLQKAIIGSPVMLLFNGERISYADHDEVMDILSAKQEGKIPLTLN